MGDTGAVVLAGGLSRRFGSPKARASWNGRALVEHVVDALPCAKEAIVLVLRREQDDGHWPVLHRVYDDPEMPEGPLRGVVAGLAECRAPWNFVVACDHPGLDARLLRALRAAADDDCEVVVPSWEGRLQPLCALYARHAVVPMRDRLQGGSGSVVRALSSLHVREYPEALCRALDPAGSSFVNVNRPGDLHALGVGRDSGPAAVPRSGARR